MAVTRDFSLTVAARARRDPRFRQALFTEALNACLAGDTRTGKAVLRDLVNATLGFERLAAEVNEQTRGCYPPPGRCRAAVRLIFALPKGENLA